ncbi:MAG: hypothetical protein LWX56_02335 [Ignavibacteria bacterium]|nr:hypothetical protein [Ignavibacteria bacterium]
MAKKKNYTVKETEKKQFIPPVFPLDLHDDFVIPAAGLHTKTPVPENFLEPDLTKCKPALSYPQEMLDTVEPIIRDMMQESDVSRGMEKAYDMIKNYPDFPEPFFILGVLSADPGNAYLFFKKCVQLGYKYLGEEFLRVYRGSLDAVPMAKSMLLSFKNMANSAWHLGQHDEYFRLSYELLNLQELDRIGARQRLYIRLLLKKEYHQMNVLMSKYREDACTAALYCKAIHLFVTGAPESLSREALATAIRNNEAVIALMLNANALPPDAEEQELLLWEEAGDFLSDAVELFQSNEKIIEWLLQTTMQIVRANTPQPRF